MSELKTYRNAQKMFRSIDGLTLVVAKEDGSPYSTSYISRLFNTLLRDNNLPLIRLHDLRHAYATHAHYSGMPIKELSVSLGHNSAVTTLDNYVHNHSTSFSPSRDNRKTISVNSGTTFYPVPSETENDGYSSRNIWAWSDMSPIRSLEDFIQ